MGHINEEVEKGLSKVICMTYEDLFRPSFKEFGRLLYFILKALEIILILIFFFILFFSLYYFFY